ncbi:ABC transporter ATP-binding protein [Paraburkholderia oxyphila]|uniref:ABC transporter ATP-binding protein n=1 Tax=Paraburkholderia oxyphila TaxID=614212 RepID=UPI0005BE1718|nr:ABC transporter ATP-binding protein [Paraburkholderia oxyphila]
MKEHVELALQASNLVKSFGGFTAVDGVSFSIGAAEAVAIIGPNGAGKSTLFDLLTGRKLPDSGEVRVFGAPVTRQPPWRRAKHGIGRSFQVSSVFPGYTALENVQIGLMLAQGRAWNLLRPATRTNRDEANVLLEKVGLAGKREVLSGELSYGDQRKLELAVALSTGPRLLLLDEPTAGMGRDESRDCLSLIHAIAAQEQMPMVFVEHDMDIVFSFATRVMVLVAGSVLIDGTPDTVRADERVKEAYFGEAI